MAKKVIKNKTRLDAMRQRQMKRRIIKPLQPKKRAPQKTPEKKFEIVHESKVSEQSEDSEYRFILKKPVTKKVKYKSGRVYKHTVYKEIPLKKFQSGGEYQIHLEHKKTHDKRFLGFGTFFNIPDISQFTGKHHAGYAFKPALNKDVPKNWILTKMEQKKIVKEIQDTSKQTGAEIRASIIPVRKYYHPKYHIFSDYKINLSAKPQVVGVSVLMQFTYGSRSWINKRVVFLDLRDELKKVRPMYKDLYKLESEIEEVINRSARINFISMIHGESDIHVLNVNGFVPTTFVPEGHVSPFGKYERYKKTRKRKETLR